MEQFFKAVEHDLKNSVYYNNRALAFGQLENYHHALQDFEKALSLTPNDAKIFHNRGNVYSSMENFDLALQDYQKAIRLSNGTNKKFFHSKGIAYEKIGENQRAEDCFQSALDIDPNYLPTLFHFGSLLFSTEQYRKAELKFSRVIDLQLVDKPKETHKLAYEARGKTFQRLENHSKALLDLEMAVKIDPENPRFLFLRGVSYLQTGKVDQALQDFESAVEFGVDEPEVYNYIGIAYKKKGKNTLSLHVGITRTSIEPLNWMPIIPISMWKGVICTCSSANWTTAFQICRKPWKKTLRTRTSITNWGWGSTSKRTF